MSRPTSTRLFLKKALALHVFEACFRCLMKVRPSSKNGAPFDSRPGSASYQHRHLPTTPTHRHHKWRRAASSCSATP